MLRTAHLDVSYGPLQALFDVSVDLAPGESVALIGPKGAGKTTLLRAIAGALRSRRGCITLGGAAIGGDPEHLQLARGIALVPAGARLFSSLTVHENLLVAQECGRPGRWNVERVLFELPMLRGLVKRPAAAVSCGQRQLVAVARALLANPDVLLCDEASRGLSPSAVDAVYRLLGKVREAGTAVALVEQSLPRALQESDRYYCFQRGRVVLDGMSLLTDARDVARACLGG